MSTARDLIKRSLVLIGAISPGETPSAQEQSDALSALNEMIDSWSNESLNLYQHVRESFPLTVGQQSYLIGPSTVDVPTDFDTVRPKEILRAAIEDGTTSTVVVTPADPLAVPPVDEVDETIYTANNELPVEIINLDQWARIQVKNVQGSYPMKLYYEPTYPNGTINLWTVPSEIKHLVLYSLKPLGNFTSVNQTISLPPGYLKMLRYGLAVELAPEYGKQADPLIVQQFVDARENIKTTNTKPVLMRADPAVLGRRRYFDWRSGK